MTDMRHMEHLLDVAQSDVAVLRRKEATYQGSWKRAGGRSAWFMLRRNMDRLLEMMRKPDDPPSWSLPRADELVERLRNRSEAATLEKEDLEVVRHLRECYVAENVFAKIREKPRGEDGTVLACLRDLRRYCLLVEAEMVARGYVEPEEKLLIGADLLQQIFGDAVHVDGEGLTATVVLDDRQTRTEVFPSAREATREIGPGQLSIMLGAGDGKGGNGELRQTRTDGATFGSQQRATTDGVGDPLFRTDAAPPPVARAGGGDASCWPDGHAPWVIPTLLAEKLNPTARAALLVQHTPDLWRLETVLSKPEYYHLELASQSRDESEKKLASMIGPCYQRLGDDYVLRVGWSPREWRHLWPILKAEYNGTELGDMPSWVRGLYEWSEGETKHKIRPEYRDWITEEVLDGAC